MLVFVLRAERELELELENGSRSEAREQAAFYLRGREVFIISIYNSEYKRLVEFYRRFGKMVCVSEERDRILLGGLLQKEVCLGPGRLLQCCQDAAQQGHLALREDQGGHGG